jgi:MFS family permease
VEFGYIVAYVPETYNLHQSAIKAVNNSKKLQTSSQLSDQLENLKILNWIHAIFLLIFSGMEFTLVFLTFDVFDYTHMQQGKLLGFIGIMSSLIQGGYVRRKAHVIGEKKIVVQGVQSCACGLALFAILAYVQKGVTLLYSGAFLFAITSGTVANCLTSLASMQCIEQDPRLAKGRALGVFRSYGQLGRAIGPLAACGMYWAYGPVICYMVGSASMIFVTVAIMAYIPQPKKNQQVD